MWVLFINLLNHHVPLRSGALQGYFVVSNRGRGMRVRRKRVRVLSGLLDLMAHGRSYFLGIFSVEHQQDELQTCIDQY